MKLSKVSIMLAGAAFVFSSGALAGESNKGKLHLTQKIEVEGKTINPGEYHQTIATFPAHVTEQACWCTGVGRALGIGPRNSKLAIFPVQHRHNGNRIFIGRDDFRRC
jgi:hypothetical protein